MRRLDLSAPDGVRWVPDVPSGTGALVVAGSSGRVDSGRARLLARHGVLAESVRWFGDAGQHDGPWEIPLETFTARVDDLAAECDRVVVVGTSFGAEAALLTGAHHEKVAAVAAFAPSDVVWAGVRADGTQTSHWTLGEEPLPYVPFVDDWVPDVEPPAYVGLYRASRERHPLLAERAAIPVERIDDVVLVAGEDDQVWPSTAMAEAIRTRRADHGLETTLITDPRAGHRAVLPDEAVPTGGTRMRRGGDVTADRALGAAAWPHLLRLMDPSG